MGSYEHLRHYEYTLDLFLGKSKLSVIKNSTCNYDHSYHYAFIHVKGILNPLHLEYYNLLIHIY